jgi:hypothetical protein
LLNLAKIEYQCLDISLGWCNNEAQFVTEAIEKIVLPGARLYMKFELAL